MMTPAFDALVIGGGPAGSTAACLLASAGWSVALVERKSFPRRKVCGEYLSATNWPLLQQLGLAEKCLALSGPSIRRVSLFASDEILISELPRGQDKTYPWGISISREELDALLLDQAAKTGVALFQPATATALRTESDGIYCGIAGKEGSREIRARIGIIAHGSWETSALLTQIRFPAKRSDLFGFKAYFANSSLPDDLMPLLTFRGGYGGMVMGARNRLSVSCCIRHDMLQRLRNQAKRKEAGDVVQNHLVASSRGVREALAGTERLGSWIASGPIQPGIRTLAKSRLFRVGNAAGEAHPVVAEGISMALQGAWLLANQLIQHRKTFGQDNWRCCEIAYERGWRRRFAPRIRTAAILARWSQSPALVAFSLPLIRWLPQVLTLGATLSGKTSTAVTPQLE